MPGILPMKVIKVGTSAQTRIAQACDRCRSKKIRCDGFRPTCTQCANVGFECKTSDKLSRRAFPRGYTESLEERVRTLEGEVRELKDLLDERDEKIEMLSKMHAQSPQRNGSSRRPSMASMHEKNGCQESIHQERDETFKLQQSPFLLEGEYTDSYFMGTSSVRTFVDAFKRKLQESGRPCSDLNIDVFFPPVTTPSSKSSNTADPWRAPPRLLSDQMVNIFFQEWAPLFPVLHRPSFLSIYEQYVSNPSPVQDKKALAQLNLVFGIATLSNDTRVSHCAESCERQWTAAMESFQMETSLVNLQCLLLAQIYCAQKGDASRLLHYKGLALSISQRLGLHLSQKRFALGALTVETRKKVFWTMYTLDCFGAAFLGLPKLLKEEDIHCEYPVDYDDEYVTEEGFLPTLPGEFTKLSSALALFRGSRILAKVLTENYPAAASHELSLRTIASLDEELQEWSDNLPTHLKLEFVQDKPSTHIISSRCPLLSLTYNYIRTLIHRPAMCANLGDKASASKMALASAHKQIIQIIQLLDERNLSFSHCLNKNEVLLLSGVGFLFQSLELDKRGKLMKDSQRLICTVIDKLQRRSAPGANEFKQLGCSMLSIGCVSPLIGKSSPASPKKADSARPESGELQLGSTNRQKQLAALAARYTLIAGDQRKERSVQEFRTSTASSPSSENCSRQSIEKSFRTLAPTRASGHGRSDTSSARTSASVSSKSPRPLGSNASPSQSSSTPNLDYFSFSGESALQPASRKSTYPPEPPLWENLLSTLEVPGSGDDSNIYDWPQVETLLSQTTLDCPAPSTSTASESIWSPGTWTMSGSETLSVPNHAAQSVLSFSDESLTSGEEFGGADHKRLPPSRSESALQSIMMAPYTPDHFSPQSCGGEMDALQTEGEG